MDGRSWSRLARGSEEKEAREDEKVNLEAFGGGFIQLPEAL